MTETVRCKFRVTEVKQHEAYVSEQVEAGKFKTTLQPMFSYTMTPVYSADPQSENKRFWDATPNGKVEFSVVHECPFQVGDEWYADFSFANRSSAERA